MVYSNGILKAKILTENAKVSIPVRQGTYKLDANSNHQVGYCQIQPQPPHLTRVVESYLTPLKASKGSLQR